MPSQAASAVTTYAFDPHFAANVVTYHDTPSSTSLQLDEFSVAAWFKTTQKPYDHAFIVNKGGLGSDSTPGKNLNYGIWLYKTGSIHAGFEDSSGVNYFVYSANTYNDGNWHYAVVAYGGSRLSLYIDGQEVAFRDLEVSPDNAGTQSVRVGANSYWSRNYFVGSIDEVRVYNRSVQSNEVSAMYSGTFSWSGQVLYLPFGTSSGSTTTTWATGYAVTVSQSGSTITAKDSNGKILASGTDAATVIQAGVNGIRTKGGGTLHINAGEYLISKTITLSAANNIIFEGDSKETTVLKCVVTDLKMLSKEGRVKTTNVTIRNIAIDGANISGKLIDFVNIKNLLIDNVTLERHNHPAPGVYIEDLDGGLVQNSIIRNPSNDGDSFAVGGYGLTFQYNEIIRQKARGGGFTSGGLVDSKIIYNNFHDFKGYAATSLENYHIRADGLYSFKNVEIAYNTYKNVDAKAINTLGHGGGVDKPGMYYNIQIHHNWIENAGLGLNINSYDAFDGLYNKVTHNSRFYENTLINTGGISAGPLKNCYFENNIIHKTSGYRGYGIWLWLGSDSVYLDLNQITDTARDDYYYTGSTNIYIDGVKVA